MHAFDFRQMRFNQLDGRDFLFADLFRHSHGREKSELIHKWVGSSFAPQPFEQRAVPDGTHFCLGRFPGTPVPGLSHSAAMRLERAGSCLIAWSRKRFSLAVSGRNSPLANLPNCSGPMAILINRRVSTPTTSIIRRI